MRTETWTFRSFALTAGLLLLVTAVTTSATADDNEAGVAHISDAPPATVHDSHLIPAGGCVSKPCVNGSSCDACSSCQTQVCEGRACKHSRRGRMGTWMTRMHREAYGDCKRGGCRSCRRRKCGYFHPSGCCGGGCPVVGKYDMVYSANPTYFDPRDGRLYSAQGHNTPMAVPLAPNVRYSYNYGWGIPSSRLTRISRIAPEIAVIRTGR